MKILIGQIRHETNTFSNISTTIELFNKSTGVDIISKYAGVRQAIGGMIDRAQELNVEVIPTFYANATPSGLIKKDAFASLLNSLIEEIQKVDQYDGICLSLHGAGVAEEVEDIEGEIIRRVRKTVGYDVPIVVTLDLHANLTEMMVKESTAIFGDNFYPHIDSYDRGVEAMNTIVDILNGRMNPVMQFIKLPLIIPTIATHFSPVKEINHLCNEWESVDGILDCTLYHGFPFSDIANPGVSVLAIADGDLSLAKQAAIEVAKMVWKEKDLFFKKLPTPSEGIQLAMASPSRPVVINETSDNPGGGAPGDGTFLLEQLIKMQPIKACFAPMYDPEVAEIAHRSGVGTYVDVMLGGKTDELHGEPLRIRAYVKSLTDGQFIRTSPMGKGLSINLGKSVRLQVGELDLIVCSARSQLMDDQLFLLHGININDYKIVALKSAHHFRAGFESLSDQIISVDSEGLSTLHFETFPFQNIKKAIYPFQKENDLWNLEEGVLK